jgi:hypothetical protein
VETSGEEVAADEPAATLRELVARLDRLQHEAACLAGQVEDALATEDCPTAHDDGQETAESTEKPSGPPTSRVAPAAGPSGAPRA